jgi:S-(hydroxymethyl)glutathione synthase
MQQMLKPAGAVFAQIAVVPSGSLRVVSGAEQLEAVDAAQAITRHTCRRCGTHMLGRVGNEDHHFYGLEFFHPELGDGTAPKIEFAGFVSSLIEGGVSPRRMTAIRDRLSGLGIPCYDGFSPELMDVLAWHKVKLSRPLETS